MINGGIIEHMMGNIGGQVGTIGSGLNTANLFEIKKRSIDFF
jgi:hypothetical protein